MKIHVYRKYPLVILAITFITLFLFSFAKDKIIINTSPSIPVGVYAIKPINTTLKQNDLVAICLSKKEQDFGLSRGYIHAGTRCNGSVPLLKSIIAIPGDNVILTIDSIIVNNTIYPYPTQKFDSEQRPLPSWPRGNYQNTQGFWIIGTNDQRSWDSRYFGPVSKNQIIFLIKPLWVVRN